MLWHFSCFIGGNMKFPYDVGGAPVIDSTSPPKPENPLNRPEINYRKPFYAVLGGLGTFLSVSFFLYGLCPELERKGWISLFAVIVYLAVISKKIIIWMVHLYQNKAPDAVRLRCVFEPSCSEYMILAIEKYGVVRGVWKGIQRLGRCHAPNGGKDYP